MFLRKVIFIVILSLFFVAVIVYGVYKALPIIIGPKIELSMPNTDTIDGSSVAISGTVTRAKNLYINGIPTPFTESGHFESRLAIYPGTNILTIEAIDRFGRTKILSKNLGSE